MPNQRGLPGRCATLWNTQRTPSSSRTRGTRSSLPMETPPLSTSTSCVLQMELQAALELGRFIADVVIRHALEAVHSQRCGDGVSIRAADLMRQDGLSGLD